MNREIKFRGHQNYGDAWLYGSLLIQDDEYLIFPQKSSDSMNSRDHYEVDPETVGQFTGLNDKNGKEIYRHDVIDWGGEQYLVEWDDDCSSFCLIILDGTELGYGLYKTEVVNIEVIGNIHEEQYKHLIK